MIQKRFLIAEDTGGGKTFSSILGKKLIDEKMKKDAEKVTSYELRVTSVNQESEIFSEEAGGRRQEAVKPLKGLVICPKKMVSTWEERLAGPEYDERGRPACYYKQDRKPKIAVLDAERSKNGEWEKVKDAEWVVVNYEMFSEELIERLMQYDFEYPVIDEVQTVRNPEGIWSHLLLKLLLEHEGMRNAYRVILSATPTPNNLIRDLPVIFKLLQPEEHGNLKETRRKLWRSNGAMIGMTLRSNMLRSKNSQIKSDLPALHDPILIGDREVTYYELEKDERAWYDLVREDEKLIIKQDKKDPNKKVTTLERIDCLRRACISPQFLGEHKDGSKYKELKAKLLESLSDHNAIVILESRFSEGITGEFEEAFLASPENESLFERLKKDPDFNNDDIQVQFYRIDGTKRKDELRREDLLKTLHAEKKDKRKFFVVLATAASVDTGIDMTFSDREIWLNFPWNYASYAQPVGRVYRPGQENEVFVDILIAKDTIEELILKLARTKQKLIDQAVDGKLLSEDDWNDIAHDFTVVIRKYLNSHLSTEEKRLKWILDTMKGKGPEMIREFFKRFEGQHAKLFTELYEKTFEYSYGGDNFRFLKNTLLPKLEEKGLIRGNNWADLGCATMMLQRTYSERNVYNIDLNPCALKMGKDIALKQGIEIKDENIQYGSFDDVRVPNESQDFAICSLALDCTNNKPQFGKELHEINRIKTFVEFNRILKMNGVLVLLLPKNKLIGSQFTRFREEMNHFGFKIVPTCTGKGSSFEGSRNRPLGANEQPVNFNNIVITLEKVGEPEVSNVTRENLNFSRQKVEANGDAGGIKDLGEQESGKKSVYSHDEFILEQIAVISQESGIINQKSKIKNQNENQESGDRSQESGIKDGYESNGEENEELEELFEEDDVDVLETEEDSEERIAHITDTIKRKIEKFLEDGTYNSLVKVKTWLRDKLELDPISLKPHKKKGIRIEPGETKVGLDNAIYFMTVDGKQVYRTEVKYSEELEGRIKN